MQKASVGRSKLASLRSRLTRYPPDGLLVSLLLLTVVAATSFLSWQQYVRFANSTRYSNHAIATLSSTAASVREAESSQRGFLLTGDRQYLDEYRNAVTATRSGLSNLRVLVGGSRVRPLLADFEKASDDKLAELATTTGLAAEGRTEEAIAVVKSNQGLRLMAAVVATQARCEKQLQSILAANRENSRFYARISQYVSTLGSAGIFVLVFLADRRNMRLNSAAARMNVQLARVNSDLQQFVFSASHDLQEPLRTLTIHSQLAVKRAREGRPFGDEIGFVEQASTLMSEIVRNLLLYTQAVSDMDTEEARADLNDVVRSVCTLLQPTIDKVGAQINYNGLPMLPISETHARILMQNLLSNALKYRSDGKAPTINIAARRQASDWILSVADNGIGIDAAYHQQIFGLFKRLHSRQEYPGTGLGLAICKKIVERYGGHISVESAKGKGSTFKVVLPAA